MKKSVGILCGLAVAIAAITTAGAWFTGKQIPGELEHAVTRANAELKNAVAGTGGSMTMELVSLEQHWFTSDARYRIVIKDVQIGQGEPLNFELGATDHIEHGPFPWTRVKSLKLLPVMAVSNSELVKSDQLAPLFEAAGGKMPVSATGTLGYGGSIDTETHVAPLKFTQDDGGLFDFAGMTLNVDGDRDGNAMKIHGNFDRLEVKVVGDRPPATFVLEGFKVGGDLSKTDYEKIYVGKLDLFLDQLQATLGPKQDVLVAKGIEQNNLYNLEGKDRLGGRLEYKVSDITYANRAVGSGQAVMTFRSLDIPSTLALSEWYQSKMPQIQAAAAEGQAMPEIQMTDAERAQVHGDLQKLLAAKPTASIEDLSFKTARGTSHFKLDVDFANPASFDLPADQLTRQIIAKLSGKLSVSKPMVGDLATLQALLGGETDAQAIAQQSNQAGEMLGMMAVQSGLATVQGDDVVSSLDYAAGQVDFNGKQMTVEEFLMMLQALVPQR
ncbi:YdgA family protein [Pseudomonas cremoricolorata]|uniref:YdgA family protein n=1 Tax=Pseudomonas cremoricolorata TaxID=157783 RepID=UPI00042A7DBE|nr:YdgA family protein [Pseudomonas cremoricolorata]